MKINYKDDIIHHIYQPVLDSLMSGRKIISIELSREEAEELDSLMVEYRYIDFDDNLVTEGGEVTIAGVTVRMEEEAFLH